MTNKRGRAAKCADVGGCWVDSRGRAIAKPPHRELAEVSAYQRFRVVIKHAAVTDGFIVEQNSDAIVFRLPVKEVAESAAVMFSMHLRCGVADAGRLLR